MPTARSHPPTSDAPPTPARASRRPRAKTAAAAQPAPRTSAREDYLECILQLTRIKGYARAVDIAATLQIAQASVTNMVQRLDAEGLLKYEKYRGLTLTAKGEKLAQGVVQRHEILTRLLRHFGLDEPSIYRDVEGMEHHISRQTLRVLTVLTEELDRDPLLAKRLRKKIA